MKPPLIATAFAILVAQVSLHALPVITSGPTPSAMFVRVGSNVTFSITATGNITPLKLQWRLDGTNIPGATNSTLAITNVQDKDHGIYTVLVADAAGAVGSPRAVLFVDTNEVAQSGGVLNFANAAPGVDAPVTNLATYPGQRVTGSNWVAQLWVGPGGLSSPQFLKSTGPLALFRNGAQAGYFLDGPRFVPLAQPGDTVTVQVRVFEWPTTLARSWENAIGVREVKAGMLPRGESNPIQVRLGASSDIPNLVGLQRLLVPGFVQWSNSILPTNVIAKLGDSVEFTWNGCWIWSSGPSPTNRFIWEKDGARPFISSNVIVRSKLDDVGEYRAFSNCDISVAAPPARLAVLFDPYFESAAIAGGTFHALIGGSISNSLTIQSSSDLTNWSPELTVTTLDGFLPFDRDISTNGPHRFFRLVWQ